MQRMQRIGSACNIAGQHRRWRASGGRGSCGTRTRPRASSAVTSGAVRAPKLVTPCHPSPEKPGSRRAQERATATGRGAHDAMRRVRHRACAHGRSAHRRVCGSVSMAHSRPHGGRRRAVPVHVRLAAKFGPGAHRNREGAPLCARLSVCAGDGPPGRVRRMGRKAPVAPPVCLFACLSRCRLGSCRRTDGLGFLLHPSAPRPRGERHRAVPCGGSYHRESGRPCAAAGASFRIGAWRPAGRCRSWGASSGCGARRRAVLARRCSRSAGTCSAGRTCQVGTGGAVARGAVATVPPVE